MPVKWTQNGGDSGVTWYESDCKKYTCVKGTYSGMLEDGSPSPSYIHHIVFKRGHGYGGSPAILGIFNTGKEATAFVNQCEANQTWPSQSEAPDTREHLDELRRYVKFHGDIAIAKRRAEEAERRDQEEAEARAIEAARRAEAEKKAAEDALVQQRKLEAELALAEEAKRQALAKQAAKDAEKAAKADAARAAKEAKAANRKPRKAKVAVEEEDTSQESLFA